MAMTRVQALERLGLSLGATETEIKKAFHRAALRTHPDRGGTEAAFRRVKDAYDWLTSSGKESGKTESTPESDVEEERLDIGSFLFVEHLVLDGKVYTGRMTAQVTVIQEEILVGVTLNPSHFGSSGRICITLRESPDRPEVSVYEADVLQRSMDIQQGLSMLWFSPFPERLRVDGHPVGYKPEPPLASPPCSDRRPRGSPRRPAPYSRFSSFRSSRWDPDLYDPDLPWTWPEWGW
jgi:hypothetical protein